jgi:D-alanyl-lipoteichoic acid acyltransferase DltB (MBOAT superfamily)
MLFNSIDFATFFAIVYLLYWVLPFRWQNRMLLAAGYVFYGWWDVRFLFLIAFSTTVDFTIGYLLGGKELPARQRWTASLFLTAAALLFLCPNWSAFDRSSNFALSVIRLKDGFVQPLGPYVLIGTVIFVAIANLSINRLTSLSETKRSRILIFCSVFVNLSFLGFFKYFNFFIDSAQDLFRSVGLDPANMRLHIVLPVGISFYTFQSLSYTIDVYRRRVTPTGHFWDFALFVAYFAPMVAGPIERARHLLPQLLQPRTPRLTQSARGVVLILLGLFKKVAIADGIAPVVDAIYGSTGNVSSLDVAAATVLFAAQIFCDFSGYTDIARGVSKLLGIDLVLNFNLPYFSRNPSEFWRRWHISLSSWLRDYLYIPLGGNRYGPIRTYINLLLTMLLGGLWHGAAWNYVLWGAYQGSLLCAHRFITRGAEPLPKPAGAAAAGNLSNDRTWTPSFPSWLSTPLQIFFFFLLTCYGWLLFRAHTFAQIAEFTSILLGLGPRHPSVITKPTTAALLGLIVLIGLQICDYCAGRLESFMFWRPVYQGLLYAVLLFILVMGTSNAPAQFIYFQF